MVIVGIISGLLAALLFVAWLEGGFGWLANRLRGRLQTNAPAPEAAPAKEEPVEELLACLADFQCSSKRENTEGTTIRIAFGYQNGMFVATIDKEKGIEVLYPCFFRADMDHFALVQYAANALNAQQHHVPTLSFSTSEETASVDLHASFFLHLVSLHEDNMNLLREGLSQCFLVREHAYAFLHARENERHTFDILHHPVGEIMANRDRAIFLLREQACSHRTPVHNRLNNAQGLALRDFLEKVLSLYKIEPFYLVVTSSKEHYTIEEADDIRSFELSSPIIIPNDGETAEFKANVATVLLAYTSELVLDKESLQYLTITLVAQEETEATLYFQVSAAQPPLADNPDALRYMSECIPPLVTLRMAFDKTTERKQLAEFNYLWQEAKDKIAAGKGGEMTAEERFLAYCDDGNLAESYFWGERRYLDKRYYEAVLYLENAYAEMQHRYYILNERLKEQFHEICYMLGFSYCEMKQYQRAYYFLDILFPLNHVRYTSEYINCLCNAGDYRALIIINNILEQVETAIKDEEEVGGLADFHNFLLRRKCYALIEARNYEEARACLTAMLSDDDQRNASFARSELDYLNRLLHHDDAPWGQEPEDAAALPDT